MSDISALDARSFVDGKIEQMNLYKNYEKDERCRLELDVENLVADACDECTDDPNICYDCIVCDELESKCCREYGDLGIKVQQITYVEIPVTTGGPEIKTRFQVKGSRIKDIRVMHRDAFEEWQDLELSEEDVEAMEDSLSHYSDEQYVVWMMREEHADAIHS